MKIFEMIYDEVVLHLKFYASPVYLVMLTPFIMGLCSLVLTRTKEDSEEESKPKK